MTNEGVVGRPATVNREGMGWRVGVSIATFFGALVAAILWLFFYAGSFSVYQNIAVVVVLFLVFIAVMGATWAPWGMRQSERWPTGNAEEAHPREAVDGWSDTTSEIGTKQGGGYP